MNIEIIKAVIDQEVGVLTIVFKDNKTKTLKLSEHDEDTGKDTYL